MKQHRNLAIALLIVLGLMAGVSGEAYAARLGGGKSFGSRPSYSAPYNRSGGYNQATPGQQPAYQQPSMATQRNQAMRQSYAQRGGLMGMLGGLALGGLLGAMLFGGAFEGINLMDILLFAGLAYLLYKLFAARSPSAGQAAAYGLGGHAYGGHPDRQADNGSDKPYQRAGFDTDILSKRGRGSDNRTVTFNAGGGYPADFDAKGFLQGAKAAYAHLQQAWDNADLGELRGLCTDKVFAELQGQLHQRTGANRTELLQVNADIMDVQDLGTERVASVLFDVMLRENADDAPTNVKEVWHFIRERNSRQPTWFLDGIQQIEG